MNYITRTGTYYEGDKAHVTDVACAPRPSNEHTWNGSSWVIDINLYKVKAITKIKTQGLTAINNMYPLATGTQTNMLMKQALITHKRVVNEQLTANDINTENTLKNVGIWINTVNDSIDSAVYTIMTATTTEQIDAVTFTLPEIPAPVWG